MTRGIRAAVLTAPRRLELERVDLPESGPEDVVVEIEACGVCATNLHAWAREPAGAAALPGAHGHEVAGVVSHAGAGVSGIAAGDRVCLEPARACGCGACEACRGGVPLLCRSQSLLPVWGFAEAIVVPARGVVRIPDGLGSEHATLAEPLASAVHGIRHSATAAGGGRIDGVRVAVLGAGPLGLLTLVAARELGAAEVTVVARHPHQERAARTLGADQVLASDEPELVQAIRQRRPRLVVEAAGGTAPTLAQAFAAVDRGGEVVVLGLFDEAQRLEVTSAVLRNVRAFFAAAYATREGVGDIDVALDLLARSGLPLGSLLTHRFALEHVDDAFRTAADKRTGALRVLVVPEAVRRTNQPFVENSAPVV